jgi:hypothetical protein
VVGRVFPQQSLDQWEIAVNHVLERQPDTMGGKFWKQGINGTTQPIRKTRVGSKVVGLGGQMHDDDIATQ